MRLRALVALIALPAIATALPVALYRGPEAGLLVGGWVFSLLFAASIVPRLVKRRWALGVADPEDEARVAFRRAVREDVIPMVDASVTRAQGEITVVVAAVEARMVKEVEAVKAAIPDLEPVMAKVAAVDECANQIGEIVEGIEARIAPLVRTAKIKTEKGEVEGLAIDFTLSSVVDAMNSLVEFVETQLPQVIGTAVETAMIQDYATKMGEKGRDALEAKAKALGIKTADRIEYLADHPELAQAGLELKETEDAVDEVLGYMGVPQGGAIRAWAKKHAVRELAERQQGGGTRPAARARGGASGGSNY